MNNQEGLINLLPDYFRPIKEFGQLMERDGEKLDELERNIRRVRDNCFIQTCDEETIADYEKKLQITGNTNLSLEERKTFVLLRYNMRPTYTISMLKEILGTLAGEGNYSIHPRYGSYELKVQVINRELEMAKRVYAMIFFIVPAHIRLLFYAKHQGGVEIPVRYSAAVRFRLSFYPRYNLPLLYLDDSWEMDGSKNLSGYNDAETIDLHPVKIRFRSAVQNGVASRANQMRILARVKENPQTFLVVRISQKVEREVEVKTRMRIQCSASCPTGNQAAMHQENYLDDEWVLDGNRALDGDTYPIGETNTLR